MEQNDLLFPNADCGVGCHRLGNSEVELYISVLDMGNSAIGLASRILKIPLRRGREGDPRVLRKDE